MKRKLKKEIKYSIYAVGFLAIVGLVYSIETTIFPLQFKSDDQYDYVSEIIFEDIVPVINVDETIGRPYNAEKVTIVKNYYNYKSDSEEQEKSLIYNQNTYLPSTGISYSNGEIFDVISIYDGTVIDVKEDDLLGKVIEIRHSNDIISVYQSLSETSVNINDEIRKGALIGKSGISNISKELDNHLYFELIVDGLNVNPEEYYDKNLSEI